MNLNVSFTKAFRDLWENKTRALLVLVALTVGVCCVSTVAVTYSILPREMDKNYLYTDPASATLWVEPLSAELVRTVADLPRIDKAEARAEIVGRYQIAPGEWRTLWLFVIQDFNDIRIDKLTPERGSWPPLKGEILLERTAVKVAKASLGDKVIVKIPNMKERLLTFTGEVHAPGLPPAWVENCVYGYIVPETLSLFGEESSFNQLKILVSDNRFDEASIRRTVYELEDWLEKKGHKVLRIDIPVPGKHVHADLMAAFIAILGAMSLLALVMSGILVTNMITSMVNRQIRQIGIMKAIGGGTGQIMRMYLVVVLVLGSAALSAGIPLGMAFGRMLSDFEAVQMLNFEIFDYRVDLWVYGITILMGSLIPILAAFFPILKAIRITVSDALSDYGVERKSFGSSFIDQWLGRLKSISGSFLLSLRSVFRRRDRLILTLLTLTVAGANLITAFNTGASIDRAVAKKFESTPYDIEVAFSRAYPASDIEWVVRSMDGVRRVETWGYALSSVVLPDDTLGKRLRIIAPIFDSELSPKPPIIAGRWFESGDSNVIVMSDALLKKVKITARLGEEIELDINRRTTTWRLIGISREFLAAGAYVPFDSFISVTREMTLASSIVIKMTNPASTGEITRNLEVKFSEAGFDVYQIWKTEDSRKVVEDHMILITCILLFMAALFIIVGGLGLASTMSLNVLDQTRELGVMRAIGATTGNVLFIFIGEGMFICALSWILGIILSIPYGALMGRIIAVFLESPLDIVFSWDGLFVWFFISFIIGSVSSFFPSWYATRQPVNKILSYE